MSFGQPQFLHIYVLVMFTNKRSTTAQFGPRLAGLEGRAGICDGSAQFSVFSGREEVPGCQVGAFHNLLHGVHRVEDNATLYCPLIELCLCSDLKEIVP